MHIKSSLPPVTTFCNGVRWEKMQILGNKGYIRRPGSNVDM